MDEAQSAAQVALDTTVEACTASGLAEALQALVQDVYAANLSRHEPDELGDTPMSFGIQCYENLKTRALRRFRSDDLEPAEAHWDISGLKVWTPSNVLRFDLGQARIVTIKVPFGEGRTPNWNRSGDWDQYSQTRHAIATENSRVLQYRSPAEGVFPLLPHPGSPGLVENYMLIWAGEPDAALTAGWLGVPVLGETPFVARETLWWDEEPHTRVPVKTAPDRGPSFDKRPAATPAVALKKQRKDGSA